MPPTSRHLVRLGRGLHPVDNVRLAPAKNRKRAYYDLSISSPKTISLLALLQPNHAVAKAVMQAHMGSVEVVARAAGKMIQPQNSRGAATDKWLGVMFHHTHTRDGDPHLHSHLILPNVMLNADGQWRAMQIVIAGPNRLKLELLYGHTLATRLRRLGFGPEIVMLGNGLPEIGKLQRMARHFGKAGTSVLDAARATTPERTTQEGAEKRFRPMDTHRRSLLPRRPDRLEIDRRQRLADQMRKPKPKAADDPVKLSREAERWTDELTNLEFRALVTLLDDLDYSNPRRPAAIVREGPPPAKQIIADAARMIPEGVKFTGPVLFRGAVVLSGGRHPWEELLRESRERMARRKKSLARIRAQMETDSIAIAQAEIEAAIERANRVRPLRPLDVPSMPSEAAPTPPAPAPDASLPQADVPTILPRPNSRRGR